MKKLKKDINENDEVKDIKMKERNNTQGIIVRALPEVLSQEKLEEALQQMLDQT